jgi:PAS domain S-box-containing protein
MVSTPARVGAGGLGEKALPRGRPAVERPFSTADVTQSQEPSPPNPWLRPVDWFVPAAIAAAGDDRRTRARILVATCLIGGSATLVAGTATNMALGLAPGIAAVNLAGGALIFAGAFLLRASGSIAWTTHAVLGLGWLMNSVLFAASDGTNLSALYAFPILPLIATLIGGTAVGVAWTVFVCVSTVVLVNLPAVGRALPLEFAVLDVQRQIARDVLVITFWVALVGVLYDLVRSGAQRDAERARRRAEESEELFAQAFQGNPDGIVVADRASHHVLECNDGFAELVGLGRTRILRRLDWTEALGMSAAQREILQKALEETGQSGEIEVSRGDRTLRVRAREVELLGRRSVLASVRDVTEHLRLEEQLRQAQKMEAVGQLAGSIAHDFNNMLTVISGYADHLSGELPGELGEMAGEIRRAADRSADLTRQLLAFSRRQVMKPQVLDLNAMLRRLERLLGRLLGEPIQVELELDPELWSVRADPGQMEQVIVNLAINARDAMPDGGTLRLSTRNVEAEPGAQLADGHWVRLRVRDDGVGMDEATLSRAFEPFFTTKEQGKGTGLGLSTVHGIVSQSGGEVTIRSDRQHGTTVDVFLPRVLGAGASAERAEAPPSVPHGSGHTILLVEDDPMVRRLASRSLGAAGYQVIEARDGDEALVTFRDLGGAVDLVLTDVVMPRRGGTELARELRQLRPDVRVLFMSGYPNAREDRDARLPPDVDLVHKPFSPATLRTRVAAALGRREDGLC